ncbi:serine/threonine protein kinase [Rhodococcus antarcticus]|uniref:non-specific serine/threonine protein kinase n=1 Tax=Rhodococcus antarcticus TaxID=2987751 RepID=A0ABY6P1E5_9NOCA|nr:serine/threonine-protein kinase [Rhodococcus antarcticus]UZJ25477.1 serine/threonine protein kinase [Rhodococcus antarcticus]
MTVPEIVVAGRYHLLSELGGGGMGAVWLAHDELLGRQVAVKQVITPVGMTGAAMAEQRQRVLREGRIAARLNHPHAVAVLDVIVDAGQPWLVMEYLPSRNLAEVLTTDGVLPVPQVAQIGAQVADALTAVHAAGIVHRDVKPANILIGWGGQAQGIVKLTDFGIARAAGDVALTQTGMLTGTPAFLAPEIARGGEPGHRSDVFSLGATLYTSLEGRPPFGAGDNSLLLLHRVARGEFDPPRQAAAMTPLLLRMLDVDPAHRPTTAQVRDALSALAAGRDGDPTVVLTLPLQLPASPRDLLPRPAGGDAPGTPRYAGTAEPAPWEPGPGKPPFGPPPGTPPRAAPRRVVAAAVALLVLGVLGGATYLLTSSDPTPQTMSAPATATGAPAPTPSETPPPPTTTAPSTTTAAPSTPPPAATPQSRGASSPVLAADVRQALTSYYALLPGNIAQAYALAGPTLQAQGYPSYRDFFAQFTSVTLGTITAQDGSLTATANVTFTRPGGAPQSETHQMTLVPGNDGQLHLDVDQFDRVN